MLKVSAITPAVVLGITLLLGQSLSAKQTTPTPGQPSLTEQVRLELVLLPFNTVFDNVGYKVDGGVVTLTGQVARPILKSAAEKAVQRITGVSQVINNIEVLPLSPMDDRIRWAVYHTLYSEHNPLSGYVWGPIPAIHIIVKNGHVTLTGVVNNDTDKNVATLIVKTVPGVFSVTNHLTGKHVKQG